MAGNTVEEAEFIVRYYERLATGDKAIDLSILQPLVGYITKTVNPAMEKYIGAHSDLLVNNYLSEHYEL